MDVFYTRVNLKIEIKDYPVGDNANDKLQTINHPNKQWR